MRCRRLKDLLLLCEDGGFEKRRRIKKMKGTNSSKWMYMRRTADIPLKWNDIRNADI
jgi:hypothetical protein